MTDQPTLTMTDIAELAQVSRAVVSMWRNRPSIHGRTIPFPQPVSSDNEQEQFDRDAIVAWLTETGRGNNREAHLDAPAATPPDGAQLEDVVTLLCLYAMTGEHLGSRDRQRLVALAEDVDPEDRLLLREVQGLDTTPQLPDYVDELIEASYGPPDALQRLMNGRLGRAIGGRGLSDELITALGRVVDGARRHLGDDGVALVPPAGHAFARRLAGGFAGIFIDGDDGPARARRRRAVIDDLVITDEAPAAVRVVSVVGESDTQALESADELVLSLGPADVGIVLGSASVLCDQLVGDAEQHRSQTLRPGNLSMAVRLPRGMWKAAHRQSLGLWVFDGSRKAERFQMADLDAVTLDLDDLESDVAAALAHTGRRAFRYSRVGELSPVLAGGPVVPRGVRAVRLPAPNTGHLDRVNAATLTTSEHLSGYDVSVTPATSRLVHRRRSIAELVAAGQLVMKRGSRIGAAHADPDGTVPVMSADGSTDDLRLDPFDAQQTYPRAARTEPGDVIFTDRQQPRARVDHTGGALVCSPSRILRIRPGATIGPYALAALINELATPGSEWQTWSVPEFPPDDAAALDEALAAAADHLAELRRREHAMHELSTNLIEAVAAGAATIDRHTAEQKAG